MDTGRINEFSSPQRVCQPKILIYDLRNNDNLVCKNYKNYCLSRVLINFVHTYTLQFRFIFAVRYEVPNGVVTDRSSLTTTVTDSQSNNCLDSIAYISDLNGNGLVVFDLAQRTSWRVDHNFFYPYPRHGTFTISGVSFDLMDGVFGMSLGKHP